MTWFLGLIQMLLIAFIALYEFEKKSSSVFLWATLFIMFGLMHFIISLKKDLVYSDAILMKASIFVIIFCCLYLLVRVIFFKHCTRKRNGYNYEQMKALLKKENFNDNLLFFILVVVVAAWIIPYLAYTGGIGNTSWKNHILYAESLPYVNVRQLVDISFYVLGGCGVIFFLKKRKFYFTVFCLLMVFDVILTTNRIEILPLVCTLISIYIFRTESLNIKTIIFAAVSAVLVIYLVYGLRVFRHYGSMNAFLSDFTIKGFLDKVHLYLRTGNGELGLLRDMYYFMDNDNKFENFGQMHTYIRMLLVYIPTRFSFGIKPPDFAISMGAAKGYGAGCSTHPTLFGDCFANAGMWGVFLGLFWGFYVSCADKVIDSRKTETFSIFCYVLNAVVFVIMGRGSVYNSFVYIAYGIPLLVFVEWLLLKYRSKGYSFKNLKLSSINGKHVDASDDSQDE